MSSSVEDRHQAHIQAITERAPAITADTRALIDSIYKSSAETP